MGTHENDLKTIISQGRWETPHIGDLGAAVNILNRTMSLLAESPGWEGEAAKAAGEKWVELQKAFVKVADAVSEVQRVNTNANAALDRAAEAIGELPASKVPSWIHDTVKAAEVGSKVFIPAMGVSVLASSAVNIFENYLGNQREHKASEASAVLEQELKEYAVQLQAIDLNSIYWTVPEPQPTPTPGPVPDPTIRVGGGGGYTPSPNPSYDVPAYPGGGSSAPGGGSSAPGGGSSAPGGGSSAPGIGGSFPSSPAYHSPSIDDGSVGTLPGYSGGSGGFGAGGSGGLGGYGGGANSGLTAGVLGGATAAGAAALRFGTGGGFGGGGMGAGGMGAGGMGAGGLAGGVSGTGGLLGAGGRGVGGAGAGGAGGSAGAGSGAGGAGAAGGARGGMMGGQPMGGANGGKKDKRPGLGGLMAPKIEDDEPEFVPLPDGARAGGRNTNPGEASSR